MSRVDDLNRILRHLQSGTPETDAAAIVSEDGLVLASTAALDYPTAMRLLFAAKGLRPKDRWVEANLAWLRELGFRDDGTTKKRRRHRR